MDSCLFPVFPVLLFLSAPSNRSRPSTPEVAATSPAGAWSEAAGRPEARGVQSRARAAADQSDAAIYAAAGFQRVFDTF
jgi:hypothetical protein